MSTTPYVDPSALPTDQQGPYNPPPAPDQPQPQMQPQGMPAPQIDPAQMQQGPTGSQPAAPPPTADAAPQPFWKTLLRGALSGLAGGAGAHNWGQALGQGAGAEMKMQQQDFENKQSAAQNASTIRFRDAQSAYNAALLAKQGALIQNMDSQQRDAYDKVKMDAIKLQQQSGRTGHWIPSGQTEDHLNSLTAQDPDGVHVPSDAIATSFGTWQWDSDTESSLRTQYQNLKALAPYYNGGALPSEQNFMTAKPAEREKMISGLNNLIAGRAFGGPEFTKDTVSGPIANIQAQLEKARKDPNAPPTVVPMLQNTLDHLLNQKNGAYGDANAATDRSIKVAGARPAAAAAEGWHAVTLPDGTSGFAQGKDLKAQSQQPATAPGAPPPPQIRPNANGQMYMAAMPDGSQVAGTQNELAAAGAANPTKLSADEAAKVHVARQAVAPNGLFHNVSKDMAAIGDDKLGPIASRWGDFMAGKVGTEPQFAALRADMGLLSTALMQAHVGSRGSDAMLEHFQHLADYRISDAATLRSALSHEFEYVNEKAALAKRGK
jgi:hypothetical protein